MGLLPCMAISQVSAQDISELKQLQTKVQQVTSDCSKATVALVTKKGSTGTGVIVNESGLILTAAHVIQGSDVVMVIFEDGKVEEAKVLGANFTRDAAMAQISKSAKYPFVTLGDMGKVKAGDFVVALGHSKGFDPRRRAPIRFGRLATGDNQRFLISECTLIGGDSGGPLFDINGKLIGIHS